MSAEYRIPRVSLTALLIAQVAVILPHVARLPVWITVVCVGAAIWRIALHLGRGVYPPAWVRVVMVVAGAVGIFVHHRTFYALEPVVSLLVLSFALKLIEVKNRRDVLVVIFLAFGVAASHFLFQQHIIDALYIAFATTLVTAALIALHQEDDTLGIKYALKSAVKILGQALPLMLILFIVFPRLSPFWGVPKTGERARTGPSESMSPGDISELANSSGLAFRASFSGEIPSGNDLYWRGLVLSHFDGRRWTVRDPAHGASGRDEVERKQRGDSVKYTILMEPSRRKWLYALVNGESSSRGVVSAPKSTLQSQVRLNRRFSFDVESWLDEPRQHALDANESYIELQLPGLGNSETRGFARKLLEQSQNKKEFVSRVLGFFRGNNFSYTLTPGLLGKNSIDEFLFQSRKGFCEHYASSFVFVMRSAGIPARVVVGYQGGELNPFDNYLLIHQYDAHAWAEVWIEGEGWLRVDPTAAVAPDRVERGMQEFWRETGSDSSLLSSFRIRQLPAMMWFRLRWDSVNYSWTKWIVRYNSKRQSEFLKNILGGTSLTRWLLIAMVTGVAFMLLVSLVLYRGRRRDRRNPVDQIYFRHVRALQQLGIERDIGEGATDFARRVSLELPDLTDALTRIAHQFELIRYSAPIEDKLKSQMNRQVADFKTDVAAFVRRCQGLSSSRRAFFGLPMRRPIFR